MRGLGTLTGVSNVYESDAVGYLEQPRFWNLAARLSTRVPPDALLVALKSLEIELGRIPTFVMGPRVIDIDILLYDELVVERDGLHVPHPRLMERPFVLRPLLDLDPALRHPVTGERLEHRLGGLGAATLTPLGSPRDVLGEF